MVVVGGSVVVVVAVVVVEMEVDGGAGVEVVVVVAWSPAHAAIRTETSDNTKYRSMTASPCWPSARRLNHTYCHAATL